jgi:hypothetical protein
MAVMATQPSRAAQAPGRVPSAQPFWPAMQPPEQPVHKASAEPSDKLRIDTLASWRCPPAARLLGLAGLIPFFGLALLSLSGDAWARPLLLLYAACILSFLGAIQWGAVLRAPDIEEGWDWARLSLGVVPSLIAWVAMMLPPFWTSLLLILGLLGTVVVESWAARRYALGPTSWIHLRWQLSIGAAASLFLGGLLLS